MPIHPKLMSPPKPTGVYLGIDPGVDGAIVKIYASGEICNILQMNKATEAEFVKFLLPKVTFAVLERIMPRPTMVFDHVTKKVVPRILKSTCVLYGNYMQVRAALTAGHTPFDAVTPQKWQKGLNLRTRAKGEEKRDWKNYLKGEAQRLFPSQKVTLAIADALLLAEYCRRRLTGTL